MLFINIPSSRNQPCYAFRLLLYTGTSESLHSSSSTQPTHPNLTPHRKGCSSVNRNILSI